MKRFIKLIIILTLCTSLNAQTGQITAEVTGFRNSNGKCIAFLYNSKDGFPTKTEKAFKTVSGSISGDECTLNFTGIAPGTYSISLVHDENGNGKIDTNFIGIPKEGLGSSNNPKSFGPPSFDDSKFELGSNNISLKIKIKYL